MDDIRENGEPEAGAPDIVEVMEDDEPRDGVNVEPETLMEPEEDGDDQADDAEADADEEPDDPEGDDEGQPDDDDDAAEPDQEMVTFSDGTKMSLADVEKGFLRDADYRRKTTEVAEERRAVEAERNTFRERQSSFDKAQGKLITFLEGLIPDEPPVSLARSDPGAYTRQQAERQAALAELQSVMSTAEEAQSLRSDAYEADLKAWRDAEGKKLVEAMPELKDDAKRAAFTKDIRDTAEALGFTAEELNGPQMADSRTQRVLHYARLGMARETARQNAQNAKRRVEAPRKGPSSKPVAQPVQRDQKAMRRLQQTGSIDDAVQALLGGR